MGTLSVNIDRLRQAGLETQARGAVRGRRLRNVFCLLCVSVIIALSGCRRASQLGAHPVSGAVTVDGVPLKEGWITFRSVNHDTRGFAGRITNGRYRAEAFAGPARVEVTASREVPAEFTSGGMGTPDIPKHEQFIPSRYNEKSELEAEIPVGGRRDLDFVLTLVPK